MSDKTTELHWYAYKIYHNKLRDIKAETEKEGLRCFIPMRVVLRTEAYDASYEEAYREEPVIPSLIFIRSSSEYMQKIRRNPASHAGVYCHPGTSDPAVIPDREMEVFIFVTTTGCRSMEAVDPNFVKGDRVRITAGIFKGAEGYITRVHGTKRFVVTIEGIAAIATTFIPKHFIEKCT